MRNPKHSLASLFPQPIDERRGTRSDREDRNTETRSFKMEKLLSERSTVVAGKEQISCNLAEEAVVLGLKAGVYYGLNSVAARIWNLIQEPKTVCEIRD